MVDVIPFGVGVDAELDRFAGFGRIGFCFSIHGLSGWRVSPPPDNPMPSSSRQSNQPPRRSGDEGFQRVGISTTNMLFQWAVYLLPMALLMSGAFVHRGDLMIGYVIVLAFLQYGYLLRGHSIRKAVLFRKYLSPRSSLQRFRKIGRPSQFFAAICSIPLSCFTWISIFVWDWPHTLAVCLGVFLGLVFVEAFLKIWLKHANQAYRPALTHLWSARFAIVVGAFVLVGFEVYSNREDFSQITAHEIENRTIARIEHEIDLVQDVGRVLTYANLNLLRVRDKFEGDARNLGWVVYLYFIVPSAISIFGIMAALRGTPVVFGIIRNTFHPKRKSRYHHD